MEHTSSAVEAASLIWRFGEVTLDSDSRELHRRGTLVEIEPKPLAMLFYLLERAGEVVTHDELLETIWLGRVVTDAVITTCVSKLRQAIGDSEQHIVRTVPRYGYRLVANIERVYSHAPSAPSNDLHLHVGDAIAARPGWTLQQQIASGTQGEVWLGAHAETGAQRVFKFGRDAASLSALKREITLSRILAESLPNNAYFVPLRGWHLETPPFFIESDYAPLGNLAHWCETQGGVHAVPLELRLEIIAQCATALAEAHAIGVLHKDLKPNNVLMTLDAQGQPQAQLCDFATGHVLDTRLLSQMGASRLGFTLVETTLGTSGTPLYLAPELLAGQPPTIASDIYSLGTMLFQMVVGDFQRMPSPGWEADIADVLLREDIATTASGNPKRRLADAGQLALRLRSLASRHALLEEQQQKKLRSEALERKVLRTQAQTGLLRALCVSLLVGCIALGALLYLYQDKTPAQSDNCVVAPIATPR